MLVRMSEIIGSVLPLPQEKEYCRRIGARPQRLGAFGDDREEEEFLTGRFLNHHSSGLPVVVVLEDKSGGWSLFDRCTSYCRNRVRAMYQARYRRKGGMNLTCAKSFIFTNRVGTGDGLMYVRRRH